MQAFERQGELLDLQADTWIERRCNRAAGEARLKAFVCYRMAWQFVAPGDCFTRLFHTSQRLFDKAMAELELPVKRFSVPYKNGELPGHFYQSNDSFAPTVLVIGGADTCHEDRFLSQGHYYFYRGYSVALVDLPGQGLVQEQGLYWEPETERPISMVIDKLISCFGVNSNRLALLGMSLGDYFACRAAAYEKRLAAVIATPVLSCPYELFTEVAKQQKAGEAVMSDAASKNFQVVMWKAGATDSPEPLQNWKSVVVNPSTVNVPFLSVLGTQEGAVWRKQTEEWHAAIPSSKKSLVILDAETGADAHCQGNNPLRLAQEVDAWLSVVIGWKC
ncbi:alpha/beta hydrolase [Mucilaginibacter rigui]|uniref:Alpha/beta hydrolase n=1 Tax=Mucilaginibacter rigui TaxID=534635 RepID=A0ABR7X947_9SPHI|nr:alpha/beta hydrolase [Mucilaginibacter rigui]MBD1386660.1 alpha/beta hydrolase [Mucilaginibacter rigui]